jgi:hypothetical protein
MAQKFVLALINCPYNIFVIEKLLEFSLLTDCRMAYILWVSSLGRSYAVECCIHIFGLVSFARFCLGKIWGYVDCPPTHYSFGGKKFMLSQTKKHKLCPEYPLFSLFNNITCTIGDGLSAWCSSITDGHLKIIIILSSSGVFIHQTVRNLLLQILGFPRGTPDTQ